MQWRVVFFLLLQEPHIIENPLQRETSSEFRDFAMHVACQEDAGGSAPLLVVCHKIVIFPQPGYIHVIACFLVQWLNSMRQLVAYVEKILL